MIGIGSRVNDLYAVLGVGPDAAQDEIKRAYRDIARKHHPDKNPGNEESERIFKEAAEAYRVLGDADLRAQYDNAVSGGGEGPDNASDIFNEIFGGPPKPHERPRPRSGKQGRPAPRSQPQREPPPREERRPSTSRARERGEDLRYTLELDLEDAAFGCERQINVPRRLKCRVCSGTGARPGHPPETCPQCNGAGNVRAQQGFFTTTKICPRCGGNGSIVVDACIECRGTGELRSQRTITVTVPAGVDSGTRLKMTGEGETGRNGGPSGDLYVQVQIKPHPFFQKEGDDLVAEVPIRFAQAALGATIDVPTLEGRVRMRVPPGSQSGRVFRLKGKGLPSPDGRGRGDQRVRVVVEVPELVTPEQRDLLVHYDQLEEQHGENPLVRDYLALLDRYYK